MRVLGRVLGGDGSRRGDLLSYLYFDPEFMEASIERGRQDAETTLASVPSGVPSGEVPWRLAPPGGRDAVHVVKPSLV